MSLDYGESEGLRQAIKYALTNPIQPRGRTSISRCAAVLTNRDRTFVGFNMYRSHPLQARFQKKVGEPEKIYIHAETHAIIQALRTRVWPNLSDMTMYVARVLRDGTPANAKPCPGCVSALAEFGVKEVYWT